MASYNSTHLVVSWSPPAIPNGVVSYVIDVRRRDLFNGDSVLTVSGMVVRDLEYLVDDPQAYSEYIINVTSQTSAGLGETQSVTLQTPEGGEYLCSCMSSFSCIVIMKGEGSSDTGFCV